jgi:CheY-like chemotaxis protein
MDPKAISGTILLVDDEPLVRKNVIAMLKEGHFKVIEAVDGLDAVAQYEDWQDEISLVIMDIKMPRMNGINAARKIKELNYFSKIIFISGSTLQAPPEDLADAFLTKPLRGRDLLNTVNRVLQAKKIMAPYLGGT